MKHRYTPRALADREAIFAYLHRRSPAGAAQVMAQLGNAIDRLSTEPLGGTPTDIDGVRVIFIRRYPYRLFYRVRGDGLEILHIRHTSRQPGDLE